MPRKLQKYCSIYKFLEVYDKELHAAIESLCMQPLFSSKGRRGGITFLYPGDDKYKDKIIDDAYGPNPENAKQMLESLVLKDFLPTPSDFATKRDDIPNALNQKIQFVSADKDSVKLKGKAGDAITLTVEKSFVPFESSPNMAVYILKGGMIPLDGELSTNKYKQKFNKKGGDASGTHDTRCNYATNLEDKFKRSLAQKNPKENPYYEAIVSFYMWGDMNHIDMKQINKNIAWCPAVSFYAIFEPHHQDPQVVLAPTFNRWLEETGGKCPIDKLKIVQTYEYIINKAAMPIDQVKVIIAERAVKQDKLLKSPYKPVLSDNAFKEYKGNLMDAFKDEYRFIIYQYMLEVYDYPDSSIARCNAYDNMLTFVRLLANNAPKDQSDLLCLNQGLQNKNDPAAWVSSAYAFVRSDVFLHVLIPSGLLSSDKLGITEVSGASLTSNALVNLSAIKKKMLETNVKDVSIDTAKIKNLCAMNEQISKIGLAV